MSTKAKPAGGTAGSAGQRAKNTQDALNCSLSAARCQMKTIRDLSNLVDQALSQAEFHSELAAFHLRRAEEHRRVLHSLQALIPRYSFSQEATGIAGEAEVGDEQ